MSIPVIFLLVTSFRKKTTILTNLRVLSCFVLFPILLHIFVLRQYVCFCAINALDNMLSVRFFSFKCQKHLSADQNLQHVHRYNTG